MADIELVIKIPDIIYEMVKNTGTYGMYRFNSTKAIANGIQLPKGHGKLIDISKIEQDRIEKDNPIIYLTIDGNYTEAISLDYLNNLSPLIEADKAESEKQV